MAVKLNSLEAKSKGNVDWHDYNHANLFFVIIMLIIVCFIK